MGRFMYLAYPIDQATGMDDTVTLVEYVKALFLDSGVAEIAFDPGDAFTVAKGAEVGPEIERLNQYALRTADLVVAVLPAGVASIGVPMEIAKAIGVGKDVIVLTNTASWSLGNMPSNGIVLPMSEAGADGAARWASERPAVGVPGTQEPDPLPMVRLTPQGRVPTRGYEDDAGLDLYVSKTTVVPPGQFVDIPCDIAVELPEWGWGLLTGRSSTLRQKGLLVHTAIIDAGYRGPIFAGVWNMRSVPVTVKADERLAQLVVLPNLTKDLEPIVVTELTSHPRGEAGFGSTGI